MRSAVAPLLVIGVLLAGCAQAREKRWNERSTRMEQCRDRWTHGLQTGTGELRVIYFQKAFRFDLAEFPTFVIGTDINGDTIGFVDRSWPDSAAIGDRVWTAPALWTDQEMEEVRPAYQVFAKKDLNELYCAVRRLSYGRLLPAPLP